jgi:hypothetical protein
VQIRTCFHFPIARRRRRSYHESGVNVIKEFQSLSREVDQLQRGRNRMLAQKKIRQLLDLMRQRNIAFKKEMEQVHREARLTSQSMTTILAAALWKGISDNLSTTLVVLTKMAKPDQEFARLIEEHKAIVRDFIDDAEQEYRSYRETAYLLESPANAVRLREAIAEAQSGTLPVYESTEDLLKTLHGK